MVCTNCYFKSLSPPEKRRGRACRCSPGFTEISPEGAQGFCCRCLPEVPASPLPCSGELGDASEGIVTRRGTELRAPFRTVRGPRRSQLLRVGCEDQDRGCWRMRKGSPKLCKQSQFQVHSLGWEIDSRKTQRKTNRQFRGGWRQIRSGNKGKTLFLFGLVFEIKEGGVYPTLGAGRNAKG